RRKPFSIVEHDRKIMVRPGSRCRVARTRWASDLQMRSPGGSMAEQTMGMEKSWAAQRGLLRRLRQGLGLSGLAVATLGSGPCGSCPEPMLECASFEQLEGWRSEYLAEADAWCRMGAAGQAGE